MTQLIVPRRGSKRRPKTTVRYGPPQFVHHENSGKRLARLLGIPECALSCGELRPDPKSGKESMVEVVVMREHVDIHALKMRCMKKGSLLIGGGCVAVVKRLKVVFTTGIGSTFRLTHLLKKVTHT